MTELNNVYLALKTRKKTGQSFKLEKLKASYKDYIIEQLMEKRNKGTIDFWKKELQDYKRLKFPGPGDHNNKPAEIKYHVVNFDPLFLESLTRMVKKYNISVKGVCFGAYLYMLNMLSYEDDILSGLITNNRPNCEDGDKIIGCFLNTMPVRMKIPAQVKYSDYFDAVEKKLLELKRYEKLSLFEIVRLVSEKTQEQNPLFDTIFNFVDFHVYHQLQPLAHPDEKEEGSSGNRGDSSRQLMIDGSARVNTLFNFDVDTTMGHFYIALTYSDTIIDDALALNCCHFFEGILKRFVHDPEGLLEKGTLLSPEEKQKLLVDFNRSEAVYPHNNTLHQLFENQVEKVPEHIAAVGPLPVKYRTYMTYMTYISYGELNEKSNQLACYLYNEKGIRPDDRVGILMERSIDLIVVMLGILKAGGAYVPIDPFYPEERIKNVINDAGIKVMISEKKYIRSLNRLQWECPAFHSFLCMDSTDIYSEIGVEESEWMNQKKMWEYVGEIATDEITGGGWNTSYTGEPFSKEEMDEYGDNILKKLTPLLHKKMRVLEIGCASGITMYRIAPKVGFYYGTDISTVIIEKNKNRVKQEGHQNIALAVLAAHEIDKVTERDFDLVILNSVIQSFYDHNYLRMVLRKCVNLMKTEGYLFVGDVMDQQLKNHLIRELTAFKQANRDKNYKTKIDFAATLFVHKGFFEDLTVEIPGIKTVKFSPKIYTIENELTKFRYDALIKVDNKSIGNKKTGTPYTCRYKRKHKYQDDLSILETCSTAIVNTGVGPGNLVYVIYTSGSAGIPKGVLTEHRNVVNTVSWFGNKYIRGYDRPVHVPLMSDYTFDPSVNQIFASLLYGAILYVTSKDLLLDIELLRQYIDMHQIHILNFVPIMLNELLSSNRKQGSIRFVLSGGERLDNSIKENIIKRGYRLYNQYGPTETTIDAVVDQCTTDGVTLGHPISNTKCYILDKNENLAPIGVVGELYIGGAGVTRGYLNNPELTFEKFINNKLQITNKKETTSPQYPNTPLPHSPIYLTGDLARWLTEGKIDFIGRTDTQVKIRGYRIELGEIESHLLNHEKIQEVVAIAKENEKEDKFLCAYFAANQELPESELREYLEKKLPGYMIPTYFVQIEKIPLTPNGKVDRKALTAPEMKRGENYVAPRDEIEKKLVEVWQEVLGLHTTIGIDDNFFELGGHSLKATILGARIHKELHVKVPLAEVFKTPFIRGLTEYIKRTPKGKYASIEPVEKKEYYTLSSAQNRLYILQRMDMDSTAYNMPQVIPMSAKTDIEKLRKTFIKLINRHESLRTSFLVINEQPMQQIDEPHEVEFEIEYYDLQVTGALTHGDRCGWELISNFMRPLDLSQAPLLRVRLINTAKENPILLLDMHHIITDGTSQGVLTKEFAAFYSGEDLPALRLQYKDYAEWQNSDKQKELLKPLELYWIKEFPDDDLPVLNLPTDYPRPLMQSFEGCHVEFVLNKKETQTLKNITKESKATLYMVILSIFTLLISKLTGQEDVIAGTPIAARRHVDLERIIGMFVNTLAMRNFPRGEKTFKNFLAEVKRRTLEAFENQEYQFEELVDKIAVRRDLSRNPVFDVMFNLLNQSDYTGDIPVVNEQNSSCQNKYQHRRGTSKFDLNLTAVDMGKQLLFSLEYCTKLFEASTIERIIGYFRNILFVLSLNRLIKLVDIEILTNEEKEKILHLSRGIDEIYSCNSNQTVHRLFEEQVYRTPDDAAIIGPHALISCDTDTGNLQLTYKELNEKSNQLAHFLRKKGVDTDTIVGIMVERSVEMIIGILGIIKAGGAYLPIDIEYPQERKTYMLRDCGVKLLLTNDDIEDISDGISNVTELLAIRDETISCGDCNNLEYINCGSDLLYVIYTSGSTGKPKGIMLEHRNFANLIQYQYKYTDIDFSRVLQFTTISFDVSAQEIFSTLLSGGRLTLISRETLNDISELFRVVERDNLGTLFLPASFLKFVMKEEDFVRRMPGRLKHIVTAGEQVIVNETSRKYLHDNRVYLHNHYGPSETHVVTALTIDPRKDIPELPSIGRPILNTTIYILDKGIHLMPVGIPGELAIGGVQVGKGYVNNPQMTNSKFQIPNSKQIPNYNVQNYKQNGIYAVMQSCNHASMQYHSPSPQYPITPLPHSPIYLTGDLARWLPDRNIEFLGRIDHQVKIRGFRVELGEIESQLLDHDEIKEAVVLARSDEKEDKYLCAYIVPDKGLTISELRGYLSKSLPDYMIPSYFTFLDKIPLTPNRKIDRRALPEPEHKIEEDYHFPCNKIEEDLAEIWSEVLGIDKEKIGTEHNFFELGGNSLKLIILTSKIHKELEIDMSLTQIYNNPTIKDISEIIISNRYIEETMLLFNRATSTQNKIFCFPPGVGFGMVYESLTPIINDYSFYSFNFIEDDNRLKEYVDLITTHQPLGPYILFGWSAGGTLAFKVINALENHGCEVSDVILVDSFWTKNKKNQNVNAEQDLINFEKKWFGEIEEALEMLGVEFLKDKVLERTKKYREYIKNLTHLEKVNANVHLILSEWEDKNIGPNCWEKFTNKSLTIYNGFGKHAEMFNRGFLEKNAKLIREILEEISLKNKGEKNEKN